MPTSPEEKPPTPPEAKPQATPQPMEKPVVVSVTKPNKKQKEEIYGQLLNVTNIEALDRKAFAETRKIPPSTLGGMISQMKNHPSVYSELRKADFTDAQVPSWVSRPTQAVGSVSQLPGAAKQPAGTPAIVELGQENAATRLTDRVSDRVARAASSATGRT